MKPILIFVIFWVSLATASNESAYPGLLDFKCFFCDDAESLGYAWKLGLNSHFSNLDQPADVWSSIAPIMSRGSATLLPSNETTLGNPFEFVFIGGRQVHVNIPDLQYEHSDHIYILRELFDPDATLTDWDTLLEQAIKTVLLGNSTVRGSDPILPDPVRHHTFTYFKTCGIDEDSLCPAALDSDNPGPGFFLFGGEKNSEDQPFTNFSLSFFIAHDEKEGDSSPPWVITTSEISGNSGFYPPGLGGHTATWSRYYEIYDPFPPAVAQNETAGSIIIYGGKDDTDTFSPELYKYNLDLRIWDQIIVIGNKPEGRWLHSTVLYDDKLYIYGGLGDSGKVFDELWIFDLATKTWELLEPKGVIKPGALYGHTATIMADGTMVLMFGTDGTSVTNNIFLYDMEGNEWQYHCINPNHNIDGRWGHAAVNIREDLPYIVVFGGERMNDDIFTQVAYYDITGERDLIYCPELECDSPYGCCVEEQICSKLTSSKLYHCPPTVGIDDPRIYPCIDENCYSTPKGIFNYA
eukprot:TRINITY_DN360_c0_g2_i3.p1 TRINITY_DN360_c0_g2~~TRINITY_DN360_c0_g2_i3.p1  ORF type:complete len:522 (-),score=118.99 TRINITY_DN360_c0_g2_i3:1506-3071(-)